MDFILKNEEEILYGSENTSETFTDSGNLLDGETSGETDSGGDALDDNSSESESVPVTLEIDYDAIYDAVYSASYDAIGVYANQAVTDGQTINTTALSYFQGILNNQVFPTDYVIYVGGSYVYNNSTYYEYCMAYGDLDLSGTYFSGTGTLVRMRVNGNRSVTYSHDQSISVNAPMYYSRSNLGDYSGVVSYDWTGFLMLVFLMLGGLVWFFRKLMRVYY